MKNNNITKVCVAIAIGLMTSVGALAAPLNGDIDFSGLGTFNNTGVADATSITFGTVTVGAAAGTGDYSGVTVGAAATFNVLNFNTVGFTGNLAINNLWTVVDSGTTFTFDLERITVNSVTGSVLVIEGWGTAESTDANQDDWTAFFSLSTSGSGTSISFSSTTEVPDSGTTTALLGLSMLGLAGAARRLRK
jgi:hypothetical protein